MPFGRYWGIAVDAARAPHGDGNSVMKLFFLRTTPIQPAPLAGTATTIISSLEFDTRRCNPHPSRGRQHSFKAETETCLHRDATRTPYGDGNLRILDLHLVAGRCNPRPLRGRQQLLRTVEHICGRNARCNPHPSRGRQLFDKLAEGEPVVFRCNPHPSRGQQLEIAGETVRANLDAARAPHGDSN